MRDPRSIMLQLQNRRSPRHFFCATLTASSSAAPEDGRRPDVFA
jgi:hypothetical protein